MTEGSAPDLAGIYITDDYVDVVLGRDSEPTRPRKDFAELDLVIDERQHQRAFAFDRHGSVEAAFAAAGVWIAERAPKLRAVGAACYGPFEAIRPEDRGDPRYGRLAPTSHGRLMEHSVPELIRNALAPHVTDQPAIVVETDVAAAAIGYIYNRSRVRPSSSPERNDTIAFVKASYGIGGAFLQASTPWYGWLHPEMGQCNVPRWPDPTGVEVSWRYGGAMNSGSVEGLASVGAIEARYAPLTFEQLAAQPRHEAWTREAWYLAQLAWTITCTVRPHCIVFGGRILGVEGLIEQIRDVFEQEIADLPSFPYYAQIERIEDYLLASVARDQSGKLYVERPGIVGALCLAAMPIKPAAVSSSQEAEDA